MTLDERVIRATAAHQAAHKAMTDALRVHADELGAEVMLALMAQMVGQLLALQDQRTMTVERAWDIISRNIEAGNAHTVESIFGKTEGNG